MGNERSMKDKQPANPKWGLYNFIRQRMLSITMENFFKAISKGIAQRYIRKQSVVIYSFVLFVLGFSLVVSPMGSLWAQSNNCGSNSTCLTVVGDLENQYLNGLAQGFADAHTAAVVVGMPYIGKTRVDNITVGAQLSFGARVEGGEDFQSNSGQEYKNLGRPIGLVLQGSYFAGVNVGGILSWFGIVQNLLGLPSFASLANFDIIIGYSNFDEFINIGGAKFGFETLYTGIKYSLISGASLPILGGWKGVVLGFGYLRSSIDFTQSKDAEETILGGARLMSSGQEKFTMESESIGVPIEVNTGIELFFINVTAGAGVLLNIDGNTKIRYEREGTLATAGGDIDLDVDLKKEASAKRSLYFYKMGFEIPILPFVRLGGEATYASEGLYGYTFAVRASL